MSKIVLWKSEATGLIPASARDPEGIVPYAVQLTQRQKRQIVDAFNNEQFELAASFIWRKALSSLKVQLSKLGMTFIAEMLDRTDIDDTSNIDQKLTDYEALRLAEELGVISGTGSFRLRQSLEQLNHFESLEGEEAEQHSLSALEAIGILRACVENILRLDRVDAAVDFKRFRDDLESRVFREDDPAVSKLLESPYFFHRACIRILLALIKTANGAQLENVLANSNLLIPLLWPKLNAPERWQVGRSYSEMHSEGRSTAASGLRRVLLKIKGFDFVPEDLRSTSFIRAARAVIDAHEGMNNFYNEPMPMRTLENMGSTIPIPAVAQCMSAVLSVKLGNVYNISWDAQKYADLILKHISKERWVYYLNQCLPSDERILYKLTQDKPCARWFDLVGAYGLRDLLEEISNNDIKKIIGDSPTANKVMVQSRAQKMITVLGYAVS